MRDLVWFDWHSKSPSSKNSYEEVLKTDPEKLAGEAVDGEIDGTVEEDAELDDEEEDLNFVSRFVFISSHLRIQEFISWFQSFIT